MDILERIEASWDIVNRFSNETRPPKEGDEDLFLTDTLELALDEISSLRAQVKNLRAGRVEGWMMDIDKVTDELLNILGHWKQARQRLNEVECNENLRCAQDIIYLLKACGVPCAPELWRKRHAAVTPMEEEA